MLQVIFCTLYCIGNASKQEAAEYHKDVNVFCAGTKQKRRRRTNRAKTPKKATEEEEEELKTSKSKTKSKTKSKSGTKTSTKGKGKKTRGRKPSIKTANRSKSRARSKSKTRRKSKGRSKSKASAKSNKSTASTKGDIEEMGATETDGTHLITTDECGRVSVWDVDAAQRRPVTTTDTENIYYGNASGSTVLTSQSFRMYCNTLVLPELHDSGSKYLLYMDNYGVHDDEECNDILAEKQVIVRPFPPNTSHFMQPIDQGIGKDLKSSMTGIVLYFCFTQLTHTHTHTRTHKYTKLISER